MNKTPRSAAIPAHWYSDPAVYEAERETLLCSEGRYVGPTAMFGGGNYFVPPQYDRGLLVSQHARGYNLLSNVCLHRGSLLLEGAGRVRVIRCPIHGWTYDLQGDLKTTPRMEGCKPARLQAEPLTYWNGLLFRESPHFEDDFRPLEAIGDLDVSDFVLVHQEAEEQAVNWKIPIEILLDNYHAPLLHPGFGRYVAPSVWYENTGAVDGPRLMYQCMRPNEDLYNNPHSKSFELWQREILRLLGGTVLQFGALVVLQVPNVILEWWPFMFVATIYEPRSAERTLMIRHFLFDPRAIDKAPSYPASAMAAWYETQRADDLAHESIHAGRRALALQRAESGAPRAFQNPMEESVRLFHAMCLDEVSKAL